MTRTRPSRRLLRRMTALIAGMIGMTLVVIGATPASAASYVSINGEGSSWAGLALQQWTSDVGNQGVKVVYDANAGSSVGRKDFATSLNAQFAVSEIPYAGDTADPQDATKPNFPYAMLPVVSGGTAFMYNLKVGGQRFTNLKLSQEAIADIFTGGITMWNDPKIAATNPGVALPAQKITVVVRSEGSGATAQFTLWLMRQFPQQYAHLCQVAGCDPKHGTSYFPTEHMNNFIGQRGSTGVTTYTVDTPYTIDYDEYAYALGQGFPVAKVQNAAGYFTVPDQYAVAVAMTQAKINTDQSSPDYLTQDLSSVYEYKDPRTYPLSMYTYELAPTAPHGGQFFTNSQGATLGYFDQYALCEGQRTMGAQGYSPLPMNLVLAALDQVKRIPGVDSPTLQKINATGQAVAAGTGNPCNNPTFKPGDSPSVNQLVKTAPFPAGCDAACQGPWAHTSGANNGPGGGGGAPQANGNSGAGTGASGTGTAQTGPTGTDNSGAVAPDAATDGGTAGGAQVCDPDTGVCTSSGGSGGAINAQNAANISAAATVIAGQNGWAGAQSLLVIIGLLILTGLFAPAAIARVVKGSGGRR
jgi:phosphate transport system substrate-binding protein